MYVAAVSAKTAFLTLERLFPKKYLPLVKSDLYFILLLNDISNSSQSFVAISLKPKKLIYDESFDLNNGATLTAHGYIFSLEKSFQRALSSSVI